ncbi:hypothetical protein SBA2_80038 [Acidobacteriia bacterium SbA2]|nr:hypothetical protein SBA2_80038 [Acidobacteriia bacterium SbA2]
MTGIDFFTGSRAVGDSLPAAPRAQFFNELATADSITKPFDISF